MDGEDLAADYQWVVWFPCCVTTPYMLIHDYRAEARYFKVSIKIFPNYCLLRIDMLLILLFFLRVYHSSHIIVPVFKRKVCVNVVSFVNFLFLFSSK